MIITQSAIDGLTGMWLFMSPQGSDTVYFFPVKSASSVNVTASGLTVSIKNNDGGYAMNVHVMLFDGSMNIA